MPRDPRKVEKREIIPDYKYNSTIIQEMINKINFRGKRMVSEKIFYGAMDLIKEKTKQEPLNVFNKAIENARPLLEVKARRVGGATYQVPVEVSTHRSGTIAIRWLLQFAKQRRGKPMREKLAEEIIATAKGEGPVIKKREDTHKMAEANRAFVHYRW